MLQDILNALKVIKILESEDFLTYDLVIKRVCEVARDRCGIEVSESDITEAARGVERISSLRMAAYYILRNRFELRYEKIALMSKRRTHATIMSGIKRIEGHLEQYRDQIG